jgi:signal transduction histidine kinase/ligand-binding sensor domain-containing protein
MPERSPFIKLVLCLSLLLFLPDSSYAAAGYNFDSWSTDDGLPQNSIQAILQTRDGYLWMTTLDGLVRFDGVRFTVYQRGITEGMSSNRLSGLFEDRDGTLWVGTEDRGVIRYKNGVFASFTTEEGLPHYQISAFGEDSDGNLLVRAAGRFVKWQDGKFVAVNAESNDAGRTGAVPAGSYSFRSLSLFDADMLYRYEGSRYEPYGIGRQYNAGKISSVYEDPRRALWVVTSEKRLFRLKADASVIEEVAVEGGLPDIRVEAVYDDDKGSIWLCTASSGLLLLRDGRLTLYGADKGFTAQRVISAYGDREGNVWLGTFNQGLYKMRRQTVAAYTEREGLPLNNIYTVYEDRAGGIWIGSWGGGLSLLKDGKLTGYARELGPAATHITALYEDSEQNLWVGSYNGGLFLVKDGRVTRLTRDEGLSSNGVSAFLQSRSGSLWVGTLDGLNSYRDGRFSSLGTKEGLVHPRIQAIYEDRSGNLWIGTFGGVSRYRDGSFTNLTERDGLSSNNIRSIYEDADGAIWLGTYDSGLNRLKDGKITRYTNKDGLFSNGAFQILEDSHDNLWISSNRGVYRVWRKELNDFAEGKIQSITSVSFDKRDGMPSSECNGGFQPAGWKTRAGLLMFPTQGGLAVIDPEAIKPAGQPPPVVIEDLIVDRKAMPYADKLEIYPGQENLEIQYTGLSFIKPDHIRFKYQLEGLDREWVEAGTRRAAYYSHLAAGEYTFRVIAANADGIWNTQGAVIRIVVHPPFWRTWWFLSLVTLAIAGLAFLAYEYRVLRLKRANAEKEAFSRQLIESQEAERKRIASELHDGLGQSLAIIKNRAALSLSTPTDHERALEQLDEIKEAASEAIDEVRHIAYDLRPYQLDKLGLTRAIRSVMEKLQNSNRLRVMTEIDEIDNIFPKELEINFYRIVQESISNIIRHAEAREVRVLIKRLETEVSLTIQDDGQGFNASEGLASDAQGRREGLGLIGIRERAHILGGRTVIHSGPGRGTTIMVKFNLKGSTDGG